MKPRERLKQKQTSRMYLRKKDHRDIILNDTYHNAIWMKKKQDGKERDELVWLKYPQRCLYLRTAFKQSGSYTAYTKGWLDLDRLWICGKSDSGSTSQYICKLQDYVVSSRIATSNTWTMDITQDGCIHKSVTFSDGRANIHQFGDNKIIVLWSGSSYPFSTIFMNIYTIEEFEIDKIEVTEINSVLPLSGRYYDWFYLGAVGNGCLIYFKSGNIGDVYEINQEDDATLTVTHIYKDEPIATQKPNLIGNASSRFIEKNGDFFCLNAYSEKIGDAQEYVQDVVVQYSYDNGRSWEITRFRVAEHTTSSSTPNAYFCMRDGTIYVYVTYTATGVVYQTKVLKMNSVNELEELETLHNVLTVPVYGNMGKGTLKNAPVEYVQIQLDSSAETTELSYHIRNLLSNEIQESWGSIEFKDGELQYQVTEPFIILSTSFLSSGRTIYFYLDAELKPNIDNFAWISDSYNDSDGEEKVIDGDYCL